jgi:hypothetical protein
MSIESALLPETLRTTQANKYLRALLTYPLNRLQKEPKVLSAERQNLETSMNDLAISQS